MVRQLTFLALSAAISFASMANGAPIAILPDAPLSEITAKVGTFFDEATSTTTSTTTSAASLPSGFVQTATSEAGHIESVISSLGGNAVTLASSGEGVVTGAHLTIANSIPTSRPMTTTSTAAPSSTASQKNGALSSVRSAETMMPVVFVTLATLVAGTAVGALGIL
ncbi:hypothetical protein FB446DRAFT_730509 [Lentinula raphanica]|nr:hypothetical protein FB446DRAFT_730509 [Lentinula raphanica]